MRCLVQCLSITAILLVCPALSQSQRIKVRQTNRGAVKLHVVQRAKTGVQPKSVYVSPDGKRIYVCNFGYSDFENVSVYDAKTLEFIQDIHFPGNAVEVAFARGKVLVTNFRKQRVEIVDPTSLLVEGSIKVGSNPKFMVVSPDETLLYVANYTQKSVTVVDLLTMKKLRTLRTGQQPRGMAITPDGSLFVASFRSHYVQQFRPGTSKEQRRFETCEFPRHLQLSPDAKTLYVTCTLGNISGYDVATGKRRLIAPTGRNPRSLSISHDGRFVATANFHSSDVTLVDLRTMTHRTSPVKDAVQLVGLAMHPDTLRVYATSWRTAEVIVLSPKEPVSTRTAPAKPSAAKRWHSQTQRWLSQTRSQF